MKQGAATVESSARASSTGKGLVALEGVARRYPMGESTVTALENVTLTVEPGEFTVVLGPSGSGKTTLLNIIGALDSATEGTVRIAGRELTRHRGASCSSFAATRSASSSRRSTCFRRCRRSRTWSSAPMSPAAVTLARSRPRCSVGSASQIALGTFRTSSPAASSSASQSPARSRPETRSCSRTSPPGELDFRTGVQILELLHAQTHEQGTAVLVVTHNREIARVAHRVIELSSGRVVSDAPVVGGPAAISDLHW